MILLNLLLSPFTAPVNGTIWLMEQIRERALKELYDPDTLRAELLQLRISYERGSVTEMEYRERSARIWEELTAIDEDGDDEDDGDTTDEE